MVEKRQQPREPNGRFLSWDGTRNRKFTLTDIERAFIAGLNETPGYERPSIKLARFMSKNGYDI